MLLELDETNIAHPSLSMTTTVESDPCSASSFDGELPGESALGGMIE